VFVLNVVDDCIPSDLGVGTTAEIEEERRLLYVAMTRARDSLHLVVRTASSRTGRLRKVTGTSMRHERASFRRGSCSTSNP
jgi:superfamily I DNA/RNA helicase